MARGTRPGEVGDGFPGTLGHSKDSGTWCLKRQGRTWLVFFFERGRKHKIERFSSEAVAREFFLAQVTPDWRERLIDSSGASER